MTQVLETVVGALFRSRSLKAKNLVSAAYGARGSEMNHSYRNQPCSVVYRPCTVMNGQIAANKAAFIRIKIVLLLVSLTLFAQYV